jgi:hypothetical protein
MRKLLALAFLFPLVALADTVTVDSPYGGQSSEWLVTNGAGGSTLTNYSLRKALLLQNLGPNAIFCTFDGQAPLATGALGYKIDAGSSFSAAIGPTVTVKCIAASAAQVTTAATQVVELR